MTIFIENTSLYQNVSYAGHSWNTNKQQEKENQKEERVVPTKVTNTITLHHLYVNFFVTFKWRRGIQTLGLSPLITLGNDILPKFQQCSILFEH